MSLMYQVYENSCINKARIGKGGNPNKQAQSALGVAVMSWVELGWSSNLN